jgi:N-formylglutamate deformylase
VTLDPIVVVDEGEGPIVATAIHDGHALRPECAERMVLDEASRFREEDPYTARIARLFPTSLVVTRSRFEVDLNRPRDNAVYMSAADAWNLDVWSEPPPAELVHRSLAEYDEFHDVLERVLRDRERRYGRFVVLDVHSYNHCREGAGCAADPAANPEINVGTGSLDRSRWGALADRFCRELAAAGLNGRPLDVRENVRFRGGYMSQWIHRTFPSTGCALAIELKKTFMDEWTGVVDDAHLEALGRAFVSTMPGLVESLKS